MVDRKARRRRSGGKSRKATSPPRRRRPNRVERLEDRLALSSTTIQLPGVAPEYTSYVQGDEYLPIYTNPADRLVNSDVTGNGVPIVLGEWETDGQQEGWNVVNGAGSSVSGGSLIATLPGVGSDNLRITLDNISPEPNLDYGFNDYLQVRMKLPAGYDQDIQFQYGTTGSGNNGFDSTREFFLPAEEIPADGQFHTYRFDVGLEVWWRNRLDDLRMVIPETGFEGQAVEIDYVEVGDQPGDVLLLNTSINVPTSIQNAGDLSYVESKHAAVWYSQSETPKFKTSDHGKTGLRTLEEAYQLFLKVHGYAEPFLQYSNQAPPAEPPAPPEPPAPEENAATLDFYGSMEQDVPVSEAVVVSTFFADGEELEIVATLDAIDGGVDGQLNRNANGVAPLSNDYVTGGDKNDWLANEELVLSYAIRDGDGADVTADYRVDITGITARWRNDIDPTMSVVVGSDLDPELGSIEFTDNSVYEVETVAPAAPIDISSHSSGFELDLVPANAARFQFRGIELDINSLVDNSEPQELIRIAEAAATIDFYGQLPQDVPQEVVNLTVPVTLGGETLQLEATLDAIDKGANGKVNRNVVGVHPVAGDYVSGGDKNDWQLDEEFVFSYVLRDSLGVDVTADYEVDITGVGAQWQNDLDPTMNMVFGSDLATPLGELAFSGHDTAYAEQTVSFDTPVTITANSAGLELDLVPTTGNRFRFRRLELDVYQMGFEADLPPVEEPPVEEPPAEDLVLLAESPATIDFYGQLAQGVAQESATLIVPVTLGNQTLQLEATLNAIDNGADGDVYRNAQGVHPVESGFTSGGDGNKWELNEEFSFSYRLLDAEGVEVTSAFSVDLTGVTAAWRNDLDPVMSLIVGSDLPTPLGQLDFSGQAAYAEQTVSFDAPVDISDQAGGLLLDLVPTKDNRFRFRGLQVNVRQMGLASEPLPSPLPDYSAERYKVNGLTWGGGSGVAVQYTYDGFQGVIGPISMYKNTTSGPQAGILVHEYAHTVQDAMPGGVTKSGYHESHADYLRERYAYYFADAFSPSGLATNLTARTLFNSNYRQEQQQFYYDDYRIHFALDVHAGEFGLPENTAALMWQAGESGQSFYEVLTQLVPEGTSVADVVAGAVRYWATVDFDYGEIMREDLYSTDQQEALFHYRNGSLLHESPDNPGWSRVPLERAPEKYAYMMHDFVPTGSTVTVELQGMDVLGEGEDWRWSLVAIDSQGNGRYSDVWGPGERSFDLLPGEDLVRMVVFATPDDLSQDIKSNYNTKPTDKHIDRLRYPYEVRFQGMEQASKQLDWNSASGAYHTNPDGSNGGWVESGATVSATAYVGVNARVLGNAQVLDNARIEDFAVVAENAIVRDDAIVSGYAAVFDNARIEDNARVRDRGMVYNNARVEERAVVEDYAIVRDDTRLRIDAIARGSVELQGGTMQGTAIVGYDYSMGWSLDDGVHHNHIRGGGGWFDDHFALTQTKPRGLIASYRTEAPAGEVLWDEFGAQHGLLRGGAQRVVDPEAQGEVIQLNGVDQHLLLDRSLVDLRDGSFGIWVKPDSLATSQTVLYAGDESDPLGGSLELSLDAAGVPTLFIEAGGASSQIVGSTSVLSGDWTHLAFTFGGGQMTLYVDGVQVGQVATTLTPGDVLGANDYLTAESVYIGRNATGNQFAGRVDDIRFYNKMRSGAEVVSEMSRRGAILGHYYADAPQQFGTEADRVESGVRNGLERTLTASIKPDSSPNTSEYQAVFDSNDERKDGTHGSGFGLDNGEFIVRLDGLGYWDTGVQATIGQWQDVTLAFNGTEAHLYVDGAQVASRTYNADPSNLAGKNYRIGFGQKNGKSYAASQYTDFDGQIQNIQILDRMILPGSPAAPLVAAAPLTGDYNGDGSVNAADYPVWRDTLGQQVTPGSGADGDRSGVIDVGDYTAWKENFGAGDGIAPLSVPAAPSSTPVGAGAGAGVALPVEEAPAPGEATLPSGLAAFSVSSSAGIAGGGAATEEAEPQPSNNDGSLAARESALMLLSGLDNPGGEEEAGFEDEPAAGYSEEDAEASDEAVLAWNA